MKGSRTSRNHRQAAYLNKRCAAEAAQYIRAACASERYVGTAALSVFMGLVVFFSATAFAKEYNKPAQISPEQRAKIDKTIAKSKNTSAISGTGEEGAIISDGVVNTNCGELSIGHVEVPKYGRKKLEVDRDIIITGDVINVPTNCRKPSK